MAIDVLSVPFPSLLELRLPLYGSDFQFEVLAEVPKERKEAGYEMKTIRIMGCTMNVRMKTLWGWPSS